MASYNELPQSKNNFLVIKIILVITEFILLNYSCKLAYFLRYSSMGPYEDHYLSFFLIFNLSWIGASLFTNGYDAHNYIQLKSFIQSFFTTASLQVFIVLIYIVSAKAQHLSRLYLVLTYTTSLLSVMTLRAIFMLVYQYVQSVNFSTRLTVLLGPGTAMDGLKSFLKDNQNQVHHFLPALPEDLSPQVRKDRIQASVEEIKTFCLQNRVYEMYVSLATANKGIVDELKDFAEDHLIYFRAVTELDALKNRNFAVEFVGPYPTLALRREPLRFISNRFVKRAFDLIFSSLVILLIFPWLMPIIALLIKLDSRGPVFYTQKRSGRNNRPFQIIKFRSMYLPGSANIEAKQAEKEDPRITRVGKILRRSSLDEMPQFINVLLGDMSVVGPRPHMLEHTETYAQVVQKFMLRHFVKPGITGLAQVNGFRGETRDPALMKKRVEFDTWYIERWSIFQDVRIIAQTVWNLVKGQEQAF